MFTRTFDSFCVCVWCALFLPFLSLAQILLWWWNSFTFISVYISIWFFRSPLSKLKKRRAKKRRKKEKKEVHSCWVSPISVDLFSLQFILSEWNEWTLKQFFFWSIEFLSPASFFFIFFIFWRSVFLFFWRFYIISFLGLVSFHYCRF